MLSIQRLQRCNVKHYLFLGDSITDCDHKYDTEGLGDGYVRIAAGWLGLASGSARITNLGEDGLTSAGLLRRIRSAKIPKADVVSVLIGINDLWMQHPDDTVSFREYYRANINGITDEIRMTSPKHIIFMEPFVFASFPESRAWQPYLDIMSNEMKRLAQENDNLSFLALADPLRREAEILGEDALTRDGIHPEQAGHETIAKQYTKLLRKLNV